MNYTITKEPTSGRWYAHKKGNPDEPVMGSISKGKAVSQEYANRMNGLPNRVDQSEQERRKRV